eukprot:jgi/Galph1/4111/GphlegSOOS_G2755.1
MGFLWSASHFSIAKSSWPYHLSKYLNKKTFYEHRFHRQHDFSCCTLIKSAKNDKVKFARALVGTRFRRDSKKILCEGFRLVSEALRRGLRPEFILYAEDIFNSASFSKYFHPEQFSCPIAFRTERSVIESISDSVTSQGILAVFEQPQLQTPKTINLALICDRIHDPGNMGSLIRSAAAANVSCIFISPQCTDPYSTKVLRGGMGAHFVVPIEIFEDWNGFLKAIQMLNISLFLADCKADMYYYEPDLTKPLALIVSSEGHGPSKELEELFHLQRFKIPMLNNVESLNVSVAGSIFLFETFRQRKIASS